MSDAAEEISTSPIRKRNFNSITNHSTNQHQNMPFTELIRSLAQPFLNDELSLPVEMTQNADDAGATEIRFLLDERSNSDAQTGLLDKGMLPWQGPALWVYNDAPMSDDDFADAFMLDSTTRQVKLDRIGKHGRGLLSVYSVTDLPSFVSRNWVVFFDPHMRHLGSSLKEKTKFGLRINLNRYRKHLTSMEGQFKPYEGVFGWSSKSSEVHYPATLFRLPLRSKLLAARSEICSDAFDVDSVKNLFRRVYRNAENMLLFTQNLLKISFYFLPEKGSLNMDVVELFSVTKKPVRVIRELVPTLNIDQNGPVSRFLDSDMQKFVRQCSLLKSCAETMRRLKLNSTNLNQSFPDSSTIISLEVKVTTGGEKLLRLRKDQSSKMWLVVGVMGKGDVITMATRYDDLIPCTSAALQLEPIQKSNLFRPVPLLDEISRNDSGGMMFRFLPMFIKTGWPVHTSGSFATSEDHRLLVKPTSSSGKYGQWNEKLLTGSLALAYIRLLTDLTLISIPDSYPFYMLWPESDQTNTDFGPFIRAFYREISRASKSLFLDPVPLFSDYGSKWSSIDTTFFLDCGYEDRALNDAALMICRQIMARSQSGYIMVQLPKKILKGFESAEASKYITVKTYNKVHFFSKVFLPYADSVPTQARDLIILEALRNLDDTPQLNSLLKEWQIVPVSPKGDVLEKATKLIDPRSKLAELFSPSDSVFPYGSYANDPSVLDALSTLGMKSKGAELSWEEIIERCRVVASNKDTNNAINHLSPILVQVINDKLLFDADRSVTNLRNVQQSLSEIAFLPAKPRPLGFKLLWANQEPSSRLYSRLYRPVELYSPAYHDLVCCTSPILDDSIINNQDSTVFQNFFKIDAKSKPVTIELVAQQLDALTNPDHESQLAINDVFKNEVESLCLKAYEFLQNKCASSPLQQKTVIEFLKGRYFVMCKNKFLLPKQLALSMPQECPPYLYQLPDNYRRDFPDLFKAMDVREYFTSQDFIEALQSMRDSKPYERLDRDNLKLANLLVEQLRQSLSTTGLKLSDVIARYGPVYIPDSNNVLRNCADLNIDDLSTCSRTPRESQSYQPQQKSFRMDQPQQRQYSDQHQNQETPSVSTTSHPMSQISRPISTSNNREQMVSRLRRVMSGRVSESDVLRELIRLADDVGATEVNFIKDKRLYRCNDDEFWKGFHGPALCMYLNKPINDDHVQNITATGHCKPAYGYSKTGDPSKTGLFGVGFDSVFKITDTPLIMTTNRGEENLYIFDPQGQFVPTTTAEEPGRCIENVTSLKRTLPCLNSLFLEDKFNIQSGAVIRLPYRSSDRAVHSELSDETFTNTSLDKMFEKLRHEIFDCLLFLKRVTTVSMFEIGSEVGVMNELYRISVETNDSNVQAKHDFHTNIDKSIQSVLRRGHPHQLRLMDLQNQEITYPLTITDNNGHWERWVVSHRFGFESHVKIPSSITEFHQSLGFVALLPYGAVAAMLDSSVAESHNRYSKVFCRLPISTNTDLPVHVNADFCVDTETGRNLWPDDDQGFRTDWNILLMRYIVSHAYVSILANTPPMLGSVKSGPGPCVYIGSLDSFGDEIPELDAYARLFPKLTRQTSQSYWKDMIESVYQIIDVKQVAIIPVSKVSLSEHPINPTSVSAVQSVAAGSTEVEWYPTRVSGLFKPHFDNLKESYRDPDEKSPQTNNSATFPFSASSQSKRRRSRSNIKKQPHEILRWILLASGFKLARLPLNVFDSFVTAGVSVTCVTPKSVIDFFKHYTKQSTSNVVMLPPLPCDLSLTPFKDESTLKLLLDYCTQDIPHFRTNLNGLPLLLTEDGMLRQFSNMKDKRVFLSSAHVLLPGLESFFVHRSLVGSVFKEADVESCDVFWRFDIRSFAAHLSEVCDRSYAVESAILRRRRDNPDRICPSDLWLKDVWMFLSEEFQRTSELAQQHQLNPQDEFSRAKTFLQPISKWCLLPVQLRQKAVSQDQSKKGMKRSASDYQNNNDFYYSSDSDESTAFLIPINLCHTVLDYSNESISGNQIRKCFGRLGLFELDVNFFEESLATTPSFTPTSGAKKSPSLFAKSSSAYNQATNKVLSFVRLIVSNPENPKAVLSAVEHVLSRPEGPENVGMNLDESFVILKYFGDSSHSWKNDANIKKTLLSLPLHLSLDDHLVPLGTEKAYILDGNIPTSGMEQWQKFSKVLFIRPCPNLHHLYSILGYNVIEVRNVYFDHVFKTFTYLPPESQQVHLNFIKDKILPILDDPLKSEFISKAHRYKIPIEYPAHSNSSNIHQSYSSISSSNFSAKPSHERTVPPPNIDELLATARRLASEAKKGSHSTETYLSLVADCKELMKTILNADVLNQSNFVEKLSLISFIPAEKVPSHLFKLYPHLPSSKDANAATAGTSTTSTGTSDAWVAFKDCVSYKYHEICWSTCYLLPVWADLFHSNLHINDDDDNNNDYLKEIADRLGYRESPTIDAVVEHLQNICTSPSQLHHFTPTAVPKQMSFDELTETKTVTKVDVLMKSYAFLQKKIEDPEDFQDHSDILKSLNKLSTIPCIVVDGGLKYVTPKQVAMNLYDDDQVSPYLCQAPAELGQFKKLLLSLGASNVATPEQYAYALESISQRAGGEKLHPNEMRLAFTAVRGLFEALRRLRYKEEDSLSRLHWLYLPTRNGYMHRSTELFFNDEEHSSSSSSSSSSLVDRLQQSVLFSRPLLVDLLECRLSADDHADLVSLLPNRLRPIFLSRSVREHLEPKCRDSVVFHAIADKLRYQLSSRMFAQGVLRLIRHERSRRRFSHRNPLRKSILDGVENSFKKIRVHGVDRVITYLTFDNRRVKGSEAELECFAEKTAEDEEDVVGSEMWNVYVNKTASFSEELQTSLAETINKITGGLLKNSIHYIQPILSCLPHSIPKVLDRLNIRPDESQNLQSPDPGLQPTLPTPGSLVPKEDHHLLKEDFEEYESGEYIGYELEDDENAAGGPTIIYAVVLEKMVHEDFDLSRPGSTTPSPGPPSTLERRKSKPQQSPQRNRQKNLSCSSDSAEQHRKFTQKYRINVGEERPPAIAPATDLYKFHRVEGRKRWNPPTAGTAPSTATDEPGSRRTSKANTPNYPGSVGDERLQEEYTEDAHYENVNDRRENEFDFRKSHSASTSNDSSQQRQQRPQRPRTTHSNKSPRSVFTENNLFTEDSVDSPYADTYDNDTRHFDKWEETVPQQPQNGGTDVCEYDEEWGARNASRQQQRQQSQQQPQQQMPTFDDGDDVVTAERVMEEVSDALEEAWQLPEAQRKKVVKRLLLRWHPDKNIGNEEFATIITQHVQAELERLELGLPRPASFDPSQFDFDPRNPFSGSSSFQQNFANAYKFFFDQMNQRAKEHKQQRERYKENYGREFSGEGQFSSFQGANPQPAQAKRFLKQAQEDLRAADNDFDALDPAYEWTCFKAHQAAEKALKAAQFSVDAVTSFSHDLVTLAASLEDMELRRLAQKLQKIVGNSNRLYNPDPIDFNVIPHEEFTREMACDSVMCAVDILERVKEFVELRDMN